MRALLILPTLVLLSACAAPEFPHTAAAPADPMAPCPDWRHARLAHPVDHIKARHANPFPAHEVAMGCSLDASIRAQIDNPRDLTAPTRHRVYTTGADAARAVGGFRTNGPAPLRGRQTASTGG